MKVEDQYTDVLQNVEQGIVMAYRDRPDLSDHGILRALEALVDAYKAENVGRPPRVFDLSTEEKDVLENMRRMCEWRLGRAPLGDDPAKEPPFDMKPKTVDEILLCLKRIQKSVDRWNRECGRQGYLNFIVRFVK